MQAACHLDFCERDTPGPWEGKALLEDEAGRAETARFPGNPGGLAQHRATAHSDSDSTASGSASGSLSSSVA